MIKKKIVIMLFKLPINIVRRTHSFISNLKRKDVSEQIFQIILSAIVRYNITII